MNEYKKKKLINIVFMIFILIVLGSSIIINKDYSVILNKKLINNKVTLFRYSDYKFVTLSMKNLSESRFSISDKDKKTNIYIINYRDKSILIELSEHSVITDTMDVMYMEDVNNTKMLKSNIKEESEKDIDFIDGYYTNVNINNNLKIINIKFYITIALGFISILIIIINLVKLLFSSNEI